MSIRDREDYHDHTATDVMEYWGEVDYVKPSGNDKNGYWAWFVGCVEYNYETEEEEDHEVDSGHSSSESEAYAQMHNSLGRYRRGE